MVRLLFIGLWTQADRAGRLLDRPKRIKAEIFPYDSFDVEKGLEQLSDAGFILRYKADVNINDRVSVPEQPINELALLQIVNFLKHQRIDKLNEKESELPAPDGLIVYDSSSDSLVKDVEGKGKEGNRKGRSSTPKCRFKESEFFDKTVFEQALVGTQYEQANVDWYHENLNNWSESKGETRADWLATAKNWIAKDMKDGKFVRKNDLLINPQKNGNTVQFTNGKSERNKGVSQLTADIKSDLSKLNQ
jgi:hypothetical protein